VARISYCSMLAAATKDQGYGNGHSAAVSETRSLQTARSCDRGAIAKARTALSESMRCLAHRSISWANAWGGASPQSRERFRAGERALAAPFVIFAQPGLVFFYLGFKIAESFLATGPHS